MQSKIYLPNYDILNNIRGGLIMEHPGHIGKYSYSSRTTRSTTVSDSRHGGTSNTQLETLLTKLKGLKEDLKNAKVTPEKALAKIKEINDDNLNALFKSTDEFMLWIKNNDDVNILEYMATIIKCLRSTYPTDFQSEQSILSNIKNNNLRKNVAIITIKSLIANKGADATSGLYTALELLNHSKYKSLLNGEAGKTLIVEVIHACITYADSNPGVIYLASGLLDLDEYQLLLGEAQCKNLMAKLIKRCIDFNEDGRILSSTNADYMLQKWENLLGEDSHKQLIINFIARCSGLDRLQCVQDANTASKLFIKHNHLLDEQEKLQLLNTLINNCIGISALNRVRDAFTARTLLELFGKLLGEKPYEEIMLNLIMTCCKTNNQGFIYEAYTGIELLSENKDWLTQEDYIEAYTNIVNGLFNDMDSSGDILLILENHREVISDEAIHTKYMQTDNISVAEAIRNFVHNHGLPITLPPREDMQAYGQVFAGGAALEIHDYTEGAEAGALSGIKQFLEAINATVVDFTVDDLRSKFNECIKDSVLLGKINDTLDKILASNSYSNKLKKALPVIATFLNSDHSSWGKDYESINQRWAMWIQQSFGEASSAYDSETDSTSCVKGIYERLFTGFRSMHFVIDCLFAVQNVTTEANNDYSRLLKDEAIIAEVITNLTKQGLKGTEEGFKAMLKQAYLEAIKKSLIGQVQKVLTSNLNKLSDKFNLLKDYLNNHVDHRKKEGIKKTLEKINDALDNMEYILLTSNDSNSQTLEDYIKGKLEVEAMPKLA